MYGVSVAIKIRRVNYDSVCKPPWHSGDCNGFVIRLHLNASVRVRQGALNSLEYIRYYKRIVSFNIEIFWITGRGAILKVSDRNKEYKVGESVEIKNRLYEITGIEGMMLLTEPPKKVTVGLRLKMTKEEYNQIISKL